MLECITVTAAILHTYEVRRKNAFALNIALDYVNPSIFLLPWGVHHPQAGKTETVTVEDNEFLYL
jgi:hypothetical protein